MSGNAQHKNLTLVPRSSNGTLPTPSDLPADIEARISHRAYELYFNRGREDGHALEDWLRAETEVLHY